MNKPQSQAEQKSTELLWQPIAPENWELKPICRVASVNDDVLPSRFPLDSEISYVDISSVTYGKGIESSESMMFAKAPSRARRLAKKGDVVVSTVRTYLKALAEVDDAHADCVFSTGFAVLRRRPTELAEGFLKWMTSNELLVQAIESHSTGVSYPAINAGDLVKLKVSVPPPNLQVRIAALLDRETARIDALIEKKTRFIALLKEKRQALITQAVTKGLDPTVPMKDSGVEWIGEVPAHWEVRPSCYLFSNSKERARATDELLSATQKYGVIPKSQFEELEGRQVVHVEKNLELRKHVEVDDFVISMRSFQGGLERSRAVGCVRSSYVVLKRAICVDPDFFELALKSKMYIQGLQSTSNFIRDGQDLTFDDFKQIALPLPSLEEQGLIAKAVMWKRDMIDRLAEKSEVSIQLLRERRSALITAAVTGQIDLRKESA